MAISVVTCCMNRNDQLAATIRQWVGRDWVDQVVVVDWSSDVPVAETLRDLGLDKVEIVRAEDETNWVLSYAYNLGIAHASGDMILKIDADCFVDDAVATRLHPDRTTFYAGNWRRSVAAGQTRSVNGQCFFTREVFEAVNGFSELIRGWGYDDEDFYTRMESAGCRRLVIDGDLLRFLDHSDDLRTIHAPRGEGAVGQRLLEQQPYVQQIKNIVVARDMAWGPWFSRARFRRLGVENGVTRVARCRDLEIPIPSAVQAQGLLLGGRMYLQQAGLDHDVIEAADYQGIVALFEGWVRAAHARPEAA